MSVPPGEIHSNHQETRDGEEEARKALERAKEAIWERIRGAGHGMHVGRLTILGLENFVPMSARHLLQEADALMR